MYLPQSKWSVASFWWKGPIYSPWNQIINWSLWGMGQKLYWSPLRQTDIKQQLELDQIWVAEDHIVCLCMHCPHHHYQACYICQPSVLHCIVIWASLMVRFSLVSIYLLWKDLTLMSIPIKSFFAISSCPGVGLGDRFRDFYLTFAISTEMLKWAKKPIWGYFNNQICLFQLCIQGPEK